MLVVLAITVFILWAVIVLQQLIIRNVLGKYRALAEQHSDLMCAYSMGKSGSIGKNGSTGAGGSIGADVPEENGSTGAGGSIGIQIPEENGSTGADGSIATEIISIYDRDVAAGRPLLACNGNPRSTQWPEVRRRFLLEHPNCAWCGGTEFPEAHHEMPFHLDPKLELDPNNLIHLCEDPTKQCHLHVGHKDNWKNYNAHVAQDCAAHTWPAGIPEVK